jgi:glutathione S-transferase
MIRLYQFEISPFCDKIRRILHVKRQPYEVVEVPLHQSFRRIPKVNPIGKLPCLEHDGRRIADSTDIALHLEEVFPDPPLLPKSPRERALCHVLEDWADESLYFYEMTLRFTVPANARRFVPELLAHDPPWLRRILAPVVPPMLRRLTRSQGVGRKPREMQIRDVERHVEALDALVGEGGWLVGPGLTLADIAVFVQLRCIAATGEGESAVARWPRVGEWLTRVDRATAAPASG